MKKCTSTLLLLFILIMPFFSYSQGWIGLGGNQMKGVNQIGGNYPLFVGIGVTLGVNITLRPLGRLQFRGLQANSIFDNYLVIRPIDGEVQYRHLPTGTTGASSITISLEGYTSASYVYTLVCDEKIISSKMMVLTNN